MSKGWQPNHTPPGGELIFEAYKIDGELNVAAFFDIATPCQVRRCAAVVICDQGLFLAAHPFAPTPVAGYDCVMDINKPFVGGNPRLPSFLRF